MEETSRVFVCLFVFVFFFFLQQNRELYLLLPQIVQNGRQFSFYPIYRHQLLGIQKNKTNMHIAGLLLLYEGKVLEEHILINIFFFVNDQRDLLRKVFGEGVLDPYHFSQVNNLYTIRQKGMLEKLIKLAHSNLLIFGLCLVITFCIENQTKQQLKVVGLCNAISLAELPFCSSIQSVSRF